MISIDPKDAIPLWKQIEDEVRRLVAVGTFRPGHPVPSVRELAQQLRINPATAAKAYQRLTDAGILAVRRGEGTFVADAPVTPGTAERDEALAAGARKYAAVASTVGASEKEAVEILRHAFREAGPGRK